MGSRQCGKTTLARQLVSAGSPNYFDLEDPVSLARLDQRLVALRNLTGTVVIDEVQHRPDLFPVLRVLADRRGTRTCASGRSSAPRSTCATPASTTT